MRLFQFGNHRSKSCGAVCTSSYVNVLYLNVIPFINNF
uniref:Uncharacterized protein n=1 Tax=Ascaris lumbricoides TaxID=6252 RepID=A0A9J2PZ09_ASCLU